MVKLANVLSMLCLALTATELHAQAGTTFPSRNVEIVVPVTAGGPIDAATRLLSDFLKNEWRTAVIINNMPGAAGNRGTAFVGRAAPDGYTLLSNLDSMTAAPALYRNPGYDLMKDLEPIAIFGTTSQTNLVVRPELGVKSLSEFLNLAKTNKVPLTVGNAGVGTSGHLLSALWQKSSNVAWTDVPYQGGNPAIIGLLGGQVDAFMGAVSPAVPHVKAGKLVSLGVMAPERVGDLPDVPTVREQGFPELESFNWIGIFAPGGTPANVVNAIAQQVEKFVAQPETKERLGRLSFEPRYAGPKELREMIIASAAKWADVVSKTGIEKR